MLWPDSAVCFQKPATVGDRFRYRSQRPPEQRSPDDPQQTRLTHVPSTCVTTEVGRTQNTQVVCQGEEAEELGQLSRDAWTSRINRKDLVPSAFTDVCSDHFLEGKPANLHQKIHPDWAPSLKSKESTSSTRRSSHQSGLQRFKRVHARQQKAARTAPEETLEISTAPIEPSLQVLPPEDDQRGTVVGSSTAYMTSNTATPKTQKEDKGTWRTEEMQLPPHDGDVLSVVDMHTGGEALRIIVSGYPEVKGDTVLAKRRYAKRHLDHLRRLVMYEPRGHYDMYGALPVDSEMPEADFGVLFMHNEGYSTMCGHGVIALGRFAVDYKLVEEPQSPETQVNIHCPCGVVKAFVEYSDGKTGGVRFRSVPAFAFATDVTVTAEGFGDVAVDISFGGAFYAFVNAQRFGLDVTTSRTRDLVDAATAVTAAVKAQVKLHHPVSEDLAFLYGTILTDGKDSFSSEPTANVCVFAEAEVDRSPTGSGVTARVALQYHKGLIRLNQSRTFASGATGSQFTGKAVEETRCGEFQAVVVEVAGRAHYTGVSRFVHEADDQLSEGFLLK